MQICQIDTFVTRKKIKTKMVYFCRFKSYFHPICKQYFAVLDSKKHFEQKYINLA